MRNLLGAMLVCCGVAIALPAVADAAAAVPITEKHYACISHDRQPLDGTLRYPSDPATSGKRPIVVMPGVWLQDTVAAPDLFGNTVAKHFAQNGYATFTYSQRGFGASGGLVDGGGPLTVADVSSAIDCVVRDAGGDPKRVGTFGASYGAAVGLLASARDPRIKAVFAASGWSDITQALMPAQTRRSTTIGLIGSAAVFGRIDPELYGRMLAAGFNLGIPELIEYGKVHSAKTFLPQINANKPAIFLANNFGDSLFDPNQAKSFYDALTGPKRLMMQPGEHTAAEADCSGPITGCTVIGPALRWIDRYVKGDRNGIDAELPVQIDPIGPAPREGYRTSDAGAVAKSFTLGARSGAADEGSLVQNGPAAPWTWTIGGGTVSAADGGYASPFSLLGFLLANQTKLAGSKIDHRTAAVWTGAPLPTGMRIRGAAGLTVRVTPTNAVPVSVFAYLYDVDESGVGGFVTSAPFTKQGVGIGQPVDVPFVFKDTAYDVAPGHRLRVVVDSNDVGYLDQTPLWTNLAFSGTPDRPARLTVPAKP